MEHADILIKNATILTMDNCSSVIDKGLVAVKEDMLSYVGNDNQAEFSSDVIIDARGGFVLPGLVNGHTHAAMSLFRGLADDLPLMEWLNNYIFPVESKMDGDFVHLGTLLACAEMIMSGTTTFCDMYLFADDVASAAQKAGMRCIIGEVLYDFPSPNYGPIENGFKYTESLINKWKKNDLISIAVEPHSVFTCSPDLLLKAQQTALDHQLPLIIHVSETESEIIQIKERFGKTPVDHLNDLEILGPHLIADHCVHLETREVDILAESGASVIHNPESNMKLASGIAPIPDLLNKNIPVGLGTDGCASNNNLDLFTEMDMAAKLHKIHAMDPTVMDAETVLKMATIEGANALGLGDLIGSLEMGKKADLIIIDTDKPHLIPVYHPFSHLVYAARGNDVSHVIVNGRLVMKERELLTLNLEEIMSRARIQSAQVRKWVL